MLANGWTLTYSNIDWDENIDCYIPIGVIVGAIHVIIGGLDFIDIDGSHKYHDYAGYTGYVMLFTKISLLIGYIYQMMVTRKEMDKKLQKYFDFLFYIGSTYFISVPLAIFAAFMYEPYQRQYVFLFIS